MRLKIKSRTGAAIYRVILDEPLAPGELKCQCFGFFFRGRCWHTTEARRMIDAGLVSANPEADK